MIQQPLGINKNKHETTEAEEEPKVLLAHKKLVSEI